MGRLYTSESDVFIRQILTYKDGPRAERVKVFFFCLLPSITFPKNAAWYALMRGDQKVAEMTDGHTNRLHAIAPHALPVSVSFPRVSGRFNLIESMAPSGGEGPSVGNDGHARDLGSRRGARAKYLFGMHLDWPTRNRAQRFPANARHWAIVGSMLGHRLRCLPNNKPTMAQYLVIS